MLATNYVRAIEYVDSVVAASGPERAATNVRLLYLRERQAYAYDRLHSETKALELARAVVKDAYEAGAWRSAAEASLTIALIYEKFNRSDDCLRTLDSVRLLLRDSDLPTSEARYYVRRASYHRFHGVSDSCGIYADWAIKQAQCSGNAVALADGVFLYLRAGAVDRARACARVKEALRYVRHWGDTEKRISLSVQLINFLEAKGEHATARRERKRLLAEVRADSSEVYANDRHLSDTYKKEAAALFAEGKSTKAYRRLQTGASIELRYWSDLHQQRIRDVERLYDLEAKERALSESGLELARQREEKSFLLKMIFLVAVLASSLLFQSIRLRRSQNDVVRQAQALVHTNGELEDALEEQVMLRSELHHRVKNNLQVIISLLDLQEDREDHLKTKSTLRTTSERVYSIAAVHELLYPKASLNGLPFRTYLDKLTEHTRSLWPADRQPAVTVDSGDYVFNLDTLVPLGVILSELLTNTRKYFGSGANTPVLSVQLTEKTNGVFQLVYRDNGTGFPGRDGMPERPGGLGSYLIRSMARQLRGQVVTYNDGGAVTEIEFRENTKIVRSDAGRSERLSLRSEHRPRLVTAQTTRATIFLPLPT